MLRIFILSDCFCGILANTAENSCVVFHMATKWLSKDIQTVITVLVKGIAGNGPILEQELEARRIPLAVGWNLNSANDFCIAKIGLP